MTSTTEYKTALQVPHDQFCGSLQLPSATSARHLSAFSSPHHVLLCSLPMPAAAANPLHHSLMDVQLPSQSLKLEHFQLQITWQVPDSSSLRAHTHSQQTKTVWSELAQNRRLLRSVSFSSCFSQNLVPCVFITRNFKNFWISNVTEIVILFDVKPIEVGFYLI